MIVHGRTHALVSAIAGVYSDVPITDPSRDARLQRLATKLMEAAGYDQGGEPFDGFNRGVLEPAPGAAWLGISPDLRALAEEHCTPKQLAALKLVAEGHGTSAIGRRLGITPQAADYRLKGASGKLQSKYLKNCTISRGNNHGGHHDEPGHSDPSELTVLCGPRSPESDPDRVRHVPFFPASDRPDLYWTTLPQSTRSIARTPAMIRGAGDVNPHAVHMPPVEDFYPDRGLQDVDARRVLMSTVGQRPVVTVQKDGESVGAHTARHKRRVNGWLDLEQTRPRLASTLTRRAVSATRSRLLPNVG